MKHWVIVTVLALLGGNVDAQTVGDFTLVNALDNNSVSLTDFNGNNGVVVIFMGNECPFADYYIGRIKQLEKECQAKQIAILLINSYKNELAASMKAYANKHGITIPYLEDKKQLVMKMLGAKKSPSAVLLKNEDAGFSIYYNGAIDNNPQVASDVRHHYLKDNIQAMLAGKPSSGKSVPPMGCLIR